MLIGFIDLNRVSMLSSKMNFGRKGFGFQLHTDDRDWNIVAETEGEMHFWVNGLKSAKERLNANSSVSPSLLLKDKNLSELSKEELISMVEVLNKELSFNRQVIEDKDNQIRMWKQKADKYETMALVLGKGDVSGSPPK